MNFEELKSIRILDVLAVRYGIKTRRKLGSVWANSRCPLPSHKPDDKGTPFAVNVESNFWQCFSESCRKVSGKKGGDVINLVSLLEDVSQFQAGKLLESWFKKAAPDSRRPVQEVTTAPPAPSPEHTVESANGKGFIKALDPWFDELFGIGPELKDDPFWKKCRNAVKAKCIESYNNGKKVAPTTR